MKNYLLQNEWKIIEEGFIPEHNRISESIFSIGNGRMGQRANFEEDYSGDTLPGSYIAGVYYPDKTRVGWWKNGYPEYFAKVLNAANWIGIKVEFDGEALDLANCELKSFRRELNMKEGYLERSFTATMKSGRKVVVAAKRFCSIADDETCAIRYSITPLNFLGTLTLKPYINADVKNQDANFDEKFWVEIMAKAKRRQAYVLAETKKTEFQVCTGMKFAIFREGKEIEFASLRLQKEKFAGCEVDLKCIEGQETVIYKYAANVSSLNYPKEELLSRCEQAVKRAYKKGFDQMLAEQAEAWDRKWQEADILIEGDTAAQQAIRYNIFQLYQTYTGEDERLNIGPKGFTGEKYGGSTYWDTEAYCIPFYLSTADQHVARNLLIYRYKHLEKAIENAQKLGFKNGAALYPMVTINGEECHNEWEITFEEIHRNGAIAYAIFNYIRYTGDKSYLVEYGLEVLIGIARFWAQRVHFSQKRKKYVIHGVTGPNEYENNVNNNWYTNYIAVWCLDYTAESVNFVKKRDPKTYEILVKKLKFDEAEEVRQWKKIAGGMYFPQDEKLGILVQHDGFLDKDLLTTADLDPKERPINQHWSWDRILRSVFIKQADVLQGLYTFEDQFDLETIRRNFDFYEPRTVHESSLSPCVHAILAARLGKKDRAYQLYLQTARLDLDDYNNDTADGCHITSMAGTWMAVVKGFGGLKIVKDSLSFDPVLPDKWKSLSFKIRWRGHTIETKVTPSGVIFFNHSDKPLEVVAFGQKIRIREHGNEAITYK